MTTNRIDEIRAREDVPYLLGRVAELETLLASLASPEPCEWRDDFCQTHRWKSDLGTCPHGRAQALLTEERAA